MAIRYAVANGNWSNTATWDGGTLPAVDDDVFANNFTVTIDGTFTVLTIRNTANTTPAITAGGFFSFTGGGNLTCTGNNGVLSNGSSVLIASSNENTLTANVFGTNSLGTIRLVDGILNFFGNTTGGGGSSHLGIYSSGNSAVLNLVGDASGGSGGNAFNSTGVLMEGDFAVLNIIGTCTGGTANSSSPHGVSMTGISATVNLTGNAVGGGNNSASAGIRISGATAILNITGNIIGGSGINCNGVLSAGASAIVNIVGNSNGSGASNAFGIYSTGASSLIDMIGIATASNANSHALRSDATSTGFGIKFSGDLIDSSAGVSAVYSRFFRISDNSGITQYANTDNFPNGGMVSRVDPSNVTGMPLELNVRGGLTFGFNNELTGTLAVPTPDNVRKGVPTDDTIGTADLTAEDLLDAIAISTNDVAVRLRNVATVETTGDQIANL